MDFTNDENWWPSPGGYTPLCPWTLLRPAPRFGENIRIYLRWALDHVSFQMVHLSCLKICEIRVPQGFLSHFFGGLNSGFSRYGYMICIFLVGKMLINQTWGYTTWRCRSTNKLLYVSTVIGVIPRLIRIIAMVIRKHSSPVHHK